jgi:hypothetical protein
MISKKIFSNRAYILIFQAILWSIFLMVLISGCSGIGTDNEPANEAQARQVEEAQDSVFAQYSSFINDYTGTISSEWLKKTEELSKKIEEQTTSEIGVAVIDNLGGLTIEDYAV